MRRRRDEFAAVSANEESFPDQDVERSRALRFLRLPQTARLRKGELEFRLCCVRPSDPIGESLEAWHGTSDLVSSPVPMSTLSVEFRNDASLLLDLREADVFTLRQ